MMTRMWKGLSVTLGAWAAGALLLRVLVVPGQHCPALTSADALQGARDAGAWMARVQRDDGSYLYEYDIEANRPVPGYNAVRHAGVTMALYQLAAYGEPGDGADVLATADRGLAWLQANLVSYDGWTALRDPDDGAIESGGNALLLAALAQRRIATSDGRYDGLMRGVGAYLRVMEQSDGSFLLAWLPTTGKPDPTQRSKYATGEAFWALALMHRLFPGEGWDEPARTVADYLALHRDTVEKQDYPPWADQWAAYGLAEMAAWPEAALGPVLNDAQITYARSLADRFGFLVRVESQRTGSWFSTLIQGRESRAAGMGTWVEALDSLWILASLDPRMEDLRGKLGERAICAAGMLRDRQVTPTEAPRYRNTDVAAGAWFTNGVTRMDDQQHALSGLLRSRAILAAGGKRNE